MSDDLEALSPLAKRLLEAEHRRPPISDEIADRLLARVGESVAVGAIASGASLSSGASTAAAAKAGTSAVAAAGLTAKAAPWIVLAFVAGGGAGAALHAAATPSPVVVPAPTPTRAPSSVPGPPSVAAPAPTPSVDPPSSPANVLSSTHPSAAPPRTAPPPPSSDVDLAAERALIDRVRMALARGQSDAALEAVAEHTTRFSRGRLVEEREALAIQALAQGGRSGDAQQRADRFRKTYPNSVFLPAVDAVTKTP